MAMRLKMIASNGLCTVCSHQMDCLCYRWWKGSSHFYRLLLVFARDTRSGLYLTTWLSISLSGSREPECADRDKSTFLQLVGRAFLRMCFIVLGIILLSTTSCWSLYKRPVSVSYPPSFPAWLLAGCPISPQLQSNSAVRACVRFLCTWLRVSHPNARCSHRRRSCVPKLTRNPHAPDLPLNPSY